MRVAYLGLFSEVFKWVYDKILGKIVEFLGSLLSTVLEWLFNTILMPILMLVLKTVLPWFLQLLKDILADTLYSLLSYICKILDYLQEMFNIFSGAQAVYFNGEKTTLLNGILFDIPGVSVVFGYVLCLSFSFLFIFSIIAVAKSTLDFDFENKRPVGAVLKATFKGFINFLIIPVMVCFIIYLSGIVLKYIDMGSSQAMGDGNDTTLGRIVFCLSTLDAAKNEKHNVSYYSYDEAKKRYLKSHGGSDASDEAIYEFINSEMKANEAENIMMAGKRGDFYSTTASGASNYTDKEKVKAAFTINKFDFITSLVVCLFLGTVMATCAIVFVQRIFEILILYIVSPFFISTMPIDDGERFKKWKELFIGKVFSGYGGVLAMQLYLMLVPVIMGNDINWGQKSTEGNYLFKIVFLCGGAYALTKVGSMITTMINWQAGQSEGAIQKAVGDKTGALVSAGIGKVGSLAIGGAAFMGKAIGAPGSYLFGKMGQEAGDEKFNDMISEQESEFPDADNTSTSISDGPNGTKNVDITRPDAGGDGSGNKSDDKQGKRPEQDDLKFAGGSGTAKQNGFDKFVSGLHDILPTKSNKDGSYSVGLLGFKLNYDKNGNRTGFKLPGMNFKYDKNGQSHLTTIGAGSFQLKRNATTGNMNLASLPGLKLKEDPNGNLHVSNALGVKFGMGYNKSTGEYKVQGMRIGNMNFKNFNK